MRKWTAMAMVLIGLSSPARALVLVAYSAVPLPQLLANADLVVVVNGGDVEKGKAEERALKLPGQDAPVKVKFTAYTAKVASILGGAKAKALAGEGRTPTVVFLCPQPEVRVNAIRPARPVRGGPRPLPGVPGRTIPSFVGGRKYLLILQALSGSESYLLPTSPDHFRMANDETIEQARKLADIGAWSWGRADDAGLQVAVLPRQEQLPSYRGRAALNLLVVVRNTGDKPVRFSLHPRNKPLHLLAINAEGTVVEADPYRGRLASYNPGLVNQPKYIQHELEPGQLAFIGLNGLSGWGFQTQVALAEGKWKLHAVFRGKDDDGGRLWTGEVRSKGVDVEVRKPKQRNRRRLEIEHQLLPPGR